MLLEKDMARSKWKYFDIEIPGPIKKDDLLQLIRKELDEETHTEMVDRLSALTIRIEGIKDQPPDTPHLPDMPRR